uniref:MRN complex-interacting protein N-terminal domain-containing protein n=1 Tax=Tetradesmus obliquus TaxID=3088 RepID=A0A383VWZ4_TETOB|eukprot:jgi/Sobl393_1/13443/SZX69987.1
MPQTFLALQCSFCEAYQVTLDKASKKFACAICCQKQSFKTIHAISNSAEDCRKVVQELNELRGERDRQLGSENTAAALEHTLTAATAAAAGCPASSGSAAQQHSVAWEEFAEPDAEAGLEGDDSWLAGTGEFVTTLPDSKRVAGVKRRGKAADAGDDTAVYKQPRYGQGRGKQQQQQQQEVRSAVPLSRAPPQPRYQQQPRASQPHPHPQQRQQQQPWQPQRNPAWQPQAQHQQQQWNAPAQQHNHAPQQQQRLSNGQRIPSNPYPGGPVGVGMAQHSSSTAGWSQTNAAPWQGAVDTRQLPQQQQQQQQAWRKPPLGSTLAAVKQQQQQQGGQGYSMGNCSRVDKQQQQQRTVKGASKPQVQPPPAAAGAWGAFVDEDEGAGGCSSEEEECLVDAQGMCCLGFTGPQGTGIQGTAAAAAAAGSGQLGSNAAARWS